MDKCLKSIKDMKKEKTIIKDSKKMKKKRIVSFNELKKYIVKSNTNPLFNEFKHSLRQLIEIDSILELSKNRFTIYELPSSNKQFSIIYNNSNIKFKNRLNEMLSYFTTEIYQKKISTMASSNVDDQTIYDFLKQKYKLKKDKTRKVKLYRIAKIIDKMNKYLNKMYPDSNINKLKLLDVGCGNGYKTKLINKMSGIKISGADIKEWGPYVKERKIGFPFKFIKRNPYKIPYKSKSFNCILLSLVLHHSENLVETINECKRLLDDNGIIIIIEHDIWNDLDNMIINIQHKIYPLLFNEPTCPRIGQYYNFYEWDIIFEKCGMEPIYGDRIIDDPSFNIRYDLQFIGIYKKN